MLRNMSAKAPSIHQLMLLPRVDQATARALRDVLLSPRRVDQRLQIADQILEGHGVEAVGTDFEFTDEGLRGCPRFTYVNMGDLYIVTLIRDHKNERWVISDQEWMMKQMPGGKGRRASGGRRVGNPAKTPKPPKKHAGTNWDEAINNRTRSSVRSLVGQMHVSTPDAEVVANFQKRIGKENLNTRLAKGVISYALKAHHENQALYTNVMGGTLRRMEISGDK